MSFALALVIQSTLILACAALASAAMRRCSAATRHAVWAMALLCLLALPAVSLFLPQALRMELPVLPESSVRLEAAPAVIPPVAVTSQPVAAAPPVSGKVPAPPRPAPRYWPLRSWILLGWLSGFMVILLKTVRAMIAARSMAMRSAVATSPEWTAIMTRLRHDLRVTPEVTLRIGGVLSPMTWGWRRPVILLPSLANEWTEDRRIAVLAHELAHVKRRDGTTQILVQLACSAYWFNPAVWFAERRLRIERERACDDYVLNLGTGAASYAEHLLDIASGAQGGVFLATVSMAQPSQLETRLLAILNPRLKRSRLTRRTAAFLLSCVVLLAMGVASIQVTTLLSLTPPVVAAPGVPASPPQDAGIVGDPAIVSPLPAQQPPAGATPGIAESVQASPAGAPVSPTPAPANRTVALVVVLDRSGSMAGAKMELAKEGAKTALSLLRDKDLFGVMTFDYYVQWPLPIAEVQDRDAMREAINRIYPVGNTSIYPALREAYMKLQATPADLKHIILLSDGQTPAQNFQELAAEIIANKITVSTVAVTAASDRELMSNIAMWSRGRAYYVNGGERLPEIFQKEVELLFGGPAQ